MRATAIARPLVFLFVSTAGLHGETVVPSNPKQVAPTTEASPHRPWAVKLDQPGLKNFCRVTPKLYRCAQPGEEGMRQLEKLGIKTVICLRGFHDDAEEVKGTALRTEHIHFNTWHPEDDDVVRFLKIITTTKNGPFVVHCQHGSDRTGTMIAIYRIAVQGWTKDEAIEEMTKGGYGFHPLWKNLLRYLRALDVEALKKGAGLR